MKKNLSSKSNAEDLAKTIRGYWADKGYIIETKVVPRYSVVTNNVVEYDVRTNLVNGLPKGFKWSRHYG